jgi:hypothetical protein
MDHHPEVPAVGAREILAAWLFCLTIAMAGLLWMPAGDTREAASLAADVPAYAPAGAICRAERFPSKISRG